MGAILSDENGSVRHISSAVPSAYAAAACLLSRCATCAIKPTKLGRRSVSASLQLVSASTSCAAASETCPPPLSLFLLPLPLLPLLPLPFVLSLFPSSAATAAVAGLSVSARKSPVSVVSSASSDGTSPTPSSGLRSMCVHRTTHSTWPAEKFESVPDATSVSVKSRTPSRAPTRVLQQFPCANWSIMWFVSVSSEILNRFDTSSTLRASKNQCPVSVSVSTCVSKVAVGTSPPTLPPQIIELESLQNALCNLSFICFQCRTAALLMEHRISSSVDDSVPAPLLLRAATPDNAGERRMSARSARSVPSVYSQQFNSEPSRPMLSSITHMAIVTGIQRS